MVDEKVDETNEMTELKWGRRSEDRSGSKGSTERAERAEKSLQIAKNILLVLAAVVAVILVVIAYQTSQKMEHLIKETQLSAQRNTELLAVECNLETGKPYPLPSEEPFRNTDEFLVAFCSRQVRQANVISNYITQINEAVRLQVQAHDENMNIQHGQIGAARSAQTQTTRTTRTTTRKTIPAVPGIPKLQVPTPTPTTAVPTTTTTTCVPHKRQRCK